MLGDGPQDLWIDRSAEMRMQFGTLGIGGLRHTRFYFRQLCRMCRSQESIPSSSDRTAPISLAAQNTN